MDDSRRKSACRNIPAQTVLRSVCSKVIQANPNREERFVESPVLYVFTSTRPNYRSQTVSPPPRVFVDLFDSGLVGRLGAETICYEAVREAIFRY